MFLFNLIAWNYFRARRKQLSHHSPSHPPPSIPSGVIMKDLVALETAIKDHVEHNGEKLINFHKMVQVSDILHKITGLRDTPPEVDPDKELSNIMRVSLFSLFYIFTRFIKLESRRQFFLAQILAQISFSRF